MKKIKLIISDLHLGKGRKTALGMINPLEEFYFEDKLVEFIDFYSSGKFRDYEVELIINGDFLNFLQVDYHGHFLTVVTEGVALEKLKGIIKGQEKVFRALKEFASVPHRSISYIVGNHDQAMLWPQLRAYFNECVGTSVKFKNIAYNFDGIHIEHGHMHEAANRLDPKKFFLKKDLPEPIMNLPFGSHFFIEFVMKIKQKHPHVDKVRPFNKLIRWALINETWFTLTTFVKLIGFFLKAMFHSHPTKHFPVKRIIQTLLESAIFPDLSDSAYKILKHEAVNTVVFGHTHVYEYRQWEGGKEYFNTGTWTDITSLDLKSLGKITKLTYVYIDYETGRPLCRLKEWKGYHKVEEDVVVA
ncbi:metallophosphoesterase [bacterium]|nr:metallophosphoesterase [bacterium]